MAEPAFTGGCKCGKVRYESFLPPVSVFYCHCESCRKASGQPVTAWATVKRAAFRFTASEPRTCVSSARALRGFCPGCGTPLTWESTAHADADTLDVYVATFDDPTAFPPAFHVYHAERLAWFESADSLPRYPGSARTDVPPGGGTPG